MVMLAHIVSQNSGCMWIILDYDVALASHLLTINLALPVRNLLLIFAPPSRQLAGTYVNVLQRLELPTMHSA